MLWSMAFSFFLNVYRKVLNNCYEVDAKDVLQCNVEIKTFGGETKN